MAEDAPVADALATGVFMFADGATYNGEWKAKEAAEGEEEKKEPVEGEEGAEPPRNYMRHGKATSCRERAAAPERTGRRPRRRRRLPRRRLPHRRLPRRRLLRRRSPSPPTP